MNSHRLFVTNLVMKILPSTRCFGLKRGLLRWAGANIGENVRCASSSMFLLGGSLSIGDDTWIGHDGLLIGGRASISIGKNCDVGPRVTFACGSHRIDPDGPHVAGESYSSSIEIGDGCWIGVGATILGGTKIGERSIVAAGAVVKGEFPLGCLIGGVPARIVRNSVKDIVDE